MGQRVRKFLREAGPVIVVFTLIPGIFVTAVAVEQTYLIVSQLPMVQHLLVSWR
jgi:hypothetical protein